jgi:hypothetical protein
MVHVAVTTYFWGPRHQDRLLRDCLGPLAAAMRREGMADRFWFDRYDTRGPHVVAVLTTDGPAAAVSDRIRSRLEPYLLAHPSDTVLRPEELAARHAETGGHVHFTADAQPGFGENNSCAVFAHDPRGYPFRTGEGLRCANELWQILDRQAFWVIEELAAHPGGTPFAAALRWAAAFDREITAAAPDVAGYWHYHAGTLLPAMREHPEEATERMATTSPSVIGARNLEVFSAVWSRADADWSRRADLRRLAEIAFGEPGWPAARRLALLREVFHFTFKQLGVPVSQHIPAVLFAWHRHLQAARMRDAAEAR